MEQSSFRAGVLQAESCDCKEEKKIAYAQLRKEAMHLENIKRLKTDERSLLRERIPHDGGECLENLLLCNSCKGYYSRKCFRRHRNIFKEERMESCVHGLPARSVKKWLNVRQPEIGRDFEEKNSAEVFRRCCRTNL